MTRAAYVHVGLPKAGTSYVQKTLRANADALASAGLHVLGSDRTAQRAAVWDLIGRRIDGADQSQVAGAWLALSEESERSPCERVILSEEFLVHARPKHVRAVARTLGSRDVHVVVTVRDLAGAMRSMWQQNTLKGRTISWPDYVAAVRDPERGQPTAGIAFWLRYDLQRILGVWADDANPERAHIVIVPPPRSRPTELFERFAAATGIDARELRMPDGPVHISPDAIDTELVRRLNVLIRDDLSEQRYLELMRQIRPSLGRARQHDIRFPPEHREWVRERSDELISHLRSSPYHVVGDCDDLRPEFGDEPSDGSDELSADDIAARAVELLASVVRDRSGMRRRVSHRDDATKPRPSARYRWVSSLRARAFQVRAQLLERADSGALTARAASAYLRWVSRTSTRRSSRDRGEAAAAADTSRDEHPQSAK